MSTVEVIDRAAPDPGATARPAPALHAASDVEARSPAEGTRPAPEDHRLTALGRGFIDHVLHPHHRSRLDWPAALATGHGAATPEQAEGRVVLSAWRMAAGLAPLPADATGGDEHVVALLDRPPAPAARPAPAPAPVVYGASPPTSAPPRPQAAPPWPGPPSASPPVAPHPAPADDGEGQGRPRGWERMHRRERLASAFGWVRNIGIVVILFAGWQVWGTSISQHQAQQSLGGQFRASEHQAPSPPGQAATLIAANVRVSQPKEGSVVAHLQIPAIGVDQYVVQGTAEGDLAEGPGHYAGTSMPGQAGNVAIAGHRTTYGAPFNALDQLAPGDPVVLTSASGTRLDYVVSGAPTVVSPNDVAVLNYFGDNRLTLTTCNPKFSASQRLVVVAELRTPATTTPAKTAGGAARPARVTSGGGVGWNMAYLPAALALLAVMVLLGVGNRRAAYYYGRVGRWLVLVPLWVAATYLLFGVLSSLLPATL